MNSERLQDVILHQLQTLGDKDQFTCLIFTHRQADPDALCAAGALKLLLENLTRPPGPKTTIIAPQGASVLGKQVSSALGIEYSEEIKKDAVPEMDLIIVVDTGDPKLLEPFAGYVSESPARKLLIDHHASSSVPEAWKMMSDRIVIPNSTSTCEVITLGFPHEMITKKIADMLLAGLLFDSQHLGIATSSTLEAALTLVNAGSEISASKRILRHEPDRSEVIGRIKAAQRLRYEEAAGKVIARSEISSYHAAVARMLVEIGADVGIAYGETNGEARVSARSSQYFFKDTGIDLASEMKKVSDYFNLVGGGHSTAASLSGKMDASVLADRLVQNLKSSLLKK